VTTGPGAGPTRRRWSTATPRAAGRSTTTGCSGPYRGILQCDGYATYKKLAGPKDDGGAVTLVFCWSHVRRGFYDLAKAGAAPIATEALTRIAALYRIEAEVRGKTAADRLAARQAKSPAS